MSMNILHEIKNRDPESRWTKIRGVALALICAAVLGVVAIAILLWKMLRAPGKWVARAFKDLLEDETHITKQMKGEG